MNGQMVKETVGPYACLTHTLRMIVEWASIYIMYDASINLFEKALT